MWIAEGQGASLSALLQTWTGRGTRLVASLTVQQIGYEQLSRAEIINWLGNSPLAAGWQSPADCGARSPGNPVPAVRTVGPGSDSQPGASCSGRYARGGGALGRLRGGGLRCARLTAPRAGRRARSLFSVAGSAAQLRGRAGLPQITFRGLRQSFVAILAVARCNVREVSEWA